MKNHLKTGHLVDNQDYVSVDTPNTGEVARFSDYMARWVGTGRSLFIQKSHDTQGMASQAVVSSGRAFLGSLRAA